MPYFLKQHNINADKIILIFIIAVSAKKQRIAL